MPVKKTKTIKKKAKEEKAKHIKWLSMMGKWYKKEYTLGETLKKTEYFYIQGIRNHLYSIGIYGYHIEITKSIEDEHRYAQIYIGGTLRAEKLETATKIENKDEIEKIDKMLATLFYKL